MLRLRKLHIANSNNIIISRHSINRIRDKFEMFLLLFYGVIDILIIYGTKIDDSSPMEQFIIVGYSTIYMLDRNDRGGE